MWFESLTGFREESTDQVRANILVDGETMVSTANGREMICGRLETPTLAELRARVLAENLPQGRLRLSEVVNDVQRIHTEPADSGAFFQVASQFNLLEMVSPSVTPEAGVGIYENDRTQGPACAIACGAGTIYRNYFAEVNGVVGQSADHQIDCLRDLGKALGNDESQLWIMQNGYALASKAGLRAISQRISAADESELDSLRETLRIGVHWNTQVTLGDCAHTVTQAYCSALPVAYSPHSADSWADFAQLVLEAAYEATLSVAALNRTRTGNDRVFLTLLGGGAFGNRDAWIFGAIERALECFADTPLDVALVSYGSSNRHVRQLVEQWQS